MHTPTPTTKLVCSALRRDGSPCRAYAVEGGDRCVMHSPAHQELMRAARAAGGVARNRPAPAPPVKLDTIAAQVAEIERTIDRVRAGEETVNVARVVLYGISLCRPLVELGELEERLRRLEEARAQ